jgi:hypothetical protein
MVGFLVNRNFVSISNAEYFPSSDMVESWIKKLKEDLIGFCWCQEAAGVYISQRNKELGLYIVV